VIQVVPDLLTRSAALVPDRVAVVFDGTARLSFAQLQQRANAFARGLAGRGIRPGDRVALALGGEEWPDYLVAYFATLRLGAVALLTGSRFVDDELTRVVDGYQVAAVVCGNAVRATGLACPVLPVTGIEAGQSTEDFPVRAASNDPAEVIFTSGTTRRPRGVVATHANLVHAQSTWPTAVRANHPVAHALPVGSVAAQAVLLSCVGGQHTLVVASRFAVDTFSAMVERHAATTVCLVPAMGHWLARADKAELTPMTSVRGVSFSGAPLPTSALPDLPRAFPHAEFFNFYTSTETYPARVATRVDPARPGSLGRPVGTSEVRVTAEDGTSVPPGVTGEVWLRAGGAPPRHLLDGVGDHVRDGWTRTGDLGFLDTDGHLFLTGRAADLVIVGGINVSTTRVEQVLAEHPEVAEAAVCGIDHPVLGEILAAFVTPRDPTSVPTVRQLREHAAQNLTRSEIPAIVRVLASLPRNEAGKVVKRDLPPLLSQTGAGAFVAPRTDLERRIVAVWGDVLGIEVVGVEDNFYALGGDSLTAAQIAAQLRDLGMDVDTVRVFEAPTVAELATDLEGLHA
jgi:acyl-CoA synthetase (AMP-forming)/AMP-acid ligase II